MGDFTLGVEQEFQIIDPESRELRSLITQLLEANQPLDMIELQKELHQSMVEVATGICQNVQHAREEVIRTRKEISEIAGRIGMRIGAASTHPFAQWQQEEISSGERYTSIVDELQDVARAMLIFGLHVHVGLDDKEEAIAVYNQARYFLPHFLALSASSPFFNGRKTGLQSTRTLIFKRLPRTGIPERFESYGAFEAYVQKLVKLRCIDDGRRIWWDIRPHPTFSTLEVRVCDLPTKVEHAVSLIAIIQAVVAKLSWLHRRNLSFSAYSTAMLEENKWRAARYGVGGRLIDFGREEEIPFSQLVEELIEFVDEVVDDLGSRKEVEGLRNILEEGTSADRQIAAYDASGGDLAAVVDLILEETMEGVA